MNTNVRISEEARKIAERHAKEQGFASIDEYIDALIREDRDEPIFEEWMRAEIEKGLASGPGAELTRDKLHDLVRDGIARAKQKK